MSAQAAKVLRRDLRRAVGAEAIGVIDHNAKLLESLTAQVTYLSALQGRTEIQLAKQRDEHARLRGELNALRASMPKTFREHMQWLFVGGW